MANMNSASSETAAQFLNQFFNGMRLWEQIGKRKDYIPPDNAAYPKGANPPAVYPCWYAGELFEKAGAADRRSSHGAFESCFSADGSAADFNGDAE